MGVVSKGFGAQGKWISLTKSLRRKGKFLTSWASLRAHCGIAHHFTQGAVDSPKTWHCPYHQISYGSYRGRVNVAKLKE